MIHQNHQNEIIAWIAIKSEGLYNKQPLKVGIWTAGAFTRSKSQLFEVVCV